MSRYIDADAFDERIRISVGLVEEELTDDYKDGVRCTLEMLKTHPTADVVEVVRCEDCIHWSKELKACYIHDFCEIFQKDYYCASGERKEDDEAHKHNKESRHGRWIIREPIHMHSICSCCGYYNAYSPYYNYCPNCGAEMKHD